MSIYGALVGDAIGSYLEFKKKISAQDVDIAMTLPGGGPHETRPGQITDDGELTVGLWNTLTELKPGNNNYTDIAVKTLQAYIQWFDSDPFDIGDTTYQALFTGKKMLQPGNNETYYAFLERVDKANFRSEANGALMRVTPIALWAAHHHLSAPRAAEYARIDALLSHPSTVCQEANMLYTFLATLLLYNHPVTTALQSGKAYAITLSSNVKTWYFEALLSTELGACTTPTVNEGHVKTAFMLAIQALKLGLDYRTAIKSVVSLGGDTDTNAAIVGGLVGIVNAPPSDLIKLVTSCSCDRPRDFRAKYIRAQDLLQ